MPSKMIKIICELNNPNHQVNVKLALNLELFEVKSKCRKCNFLNIKDQ